MLPHRPSPRPDARRLQERNSGDNADKLNSILPSAPTLSRVESPAEKPRIEKKTSLLTKFQMLQRNVPKAAIPSAETTASLHRNMAALTQLNIREKQSVNTLRQQLEKAHLDVETLKQELVQANVDKQQQWDALNGERATQQAAANSRLNQRKLDEHKKLEELHQVELFKWENKCNEITTNHKQLAKLLQKTQENETILQRKLVESQSLLQQHEAKIDGLATDLQNVLRVKMNEDTIQKIMAENDTLRCKLVEVNLTLDDSQTKERDARNTLSIKTMQFTQEKEALLREIGHVRDEYAALRTSSSAEILKLNQVVLRDEQTKADLESQILDLTDKCIALDETGAGLRKQLEFHGKVIDDKQLALESCKQALAKADSDVERLMQEVATLEAENLTLKERLVVVTDMWSAFKTKDPTVQALQQGRQGINEALAIVLDEKDKVHAELEHAKEEIDQLKLQLQKALAPSGEILDLKAQLANMLNKKNELLLMLDQFKADHMNLTTQHTTLRIAYDELQHQCTALEEIAMDPAVILLLKQAHLDLKDTVHKLVEAETSSEATFTCLKCMSIFVRPITLTTCGHTFCESCLHGTRSGVGYMCKECGEWSANDGFFSNAALADLAARFVYRQQTLSSELKDGNMSFAATMKNIANTNMPAGMAELAKKIRGEGNDSKFFTTSKKGETHELRTELADQSRDKKKDAVKKVIANMTVGKDVSMLFTDVVNCIQTADTQLKKLVYLYLINYAKSNPDLTILAVNTFVKDANDPNPLIRALSVRTMGCIRVDRITEYLCEPLRKCLTDEDPYVRKTAAICVAKLYDINPELVDEQGFLDMLRELISDSNPTVVANAVAALSEIADNGGHQHFKITKSVLQKLLAALNECNEWGQVFVLDALANYVPTDSREAEGIIERVTPRLQHANSAVVLSAVKVIMKFLEKVTNADTERTLSRKMAPPLVTLLSTEPEIQYVALRNINLIVQKRPNILSSEIKVFFCKYNDPIYVKMEKLEIIIRLVSERNVEQVLLEFKEYATEVDVDFVRRSVRAIGRCAIKLNNAAEKCINVLLELIQTKVNYIVQEAIIVIKDIFRKYPNQYESIIATLCENLDTLDEPEAKASMIWIIGEYAERIDNADELLQSFLDSFEDETAQVQLQLLTATVKLFLKRPNETQAMVQAVLKKATEESDNPDLRDRGYVYWRLLSANPEAAKAVVLAEKPVINDDTFTLEPAILDELIGKISTLASVYHKLPSAFVVRTNIAEIQRQNEEERDTEGDERYEETETSDGSASTSAGGVDLLDMGGLSVGGNTASSAPPAAPVLDIFGGGPVSTPAAATVKKNPYTNPQTGKGLVIQGSYARRQGTFALDLDFDNQSNVTVPGVAIQLNKSTFGVVPTQPQVNFPQPLAPGQRASASIPMTVSPQFVNASVAPNTVVQAALKNLGSGDVIYFSTDLDVTVILTENGLVDKGDFINLWKGIPETNETYFTINLSGAKSNVDALANVLKSRNIFYVAKRAVDGKEIGYFSFKTMTNVSALLEVTYDGSNIAKVCVKGEQMAFNPVFQKMIEQATL